MFIRTHELPITRKAALGGLSRGSVYYMPRPDNTEDLEHLFMDYIDWYNNRRAHISLDRQTLHEAFTALLPAVLWRLNNANLPFINQEDLFKPSRPLLILLRALSH